MNIDVLNCLFLIRESVWKDATGVEDDDSFQILEEALKVCLGSFESSVLTTFQGINEFMSSIAQPLFTAILDDILSIYGRGVNEFKSRYSFFDIFSIF